MKMDSLEQLNRQGCLNSEEEKYAVYFSHGDKFEVIATSEEEAMKKAKALYFELGGYCTRVVRLNYKDSEKTRGNQTGITPLLL
jgi:hypothetical protein